MAAVQPEVVCSLAALILHAGRKPITAESMGIVLAAAGATVPNYWMKFFASAADSLDFEELMKAAVSSGAAAGAAAPAASGATGAAAPEKEEPAPVEEEEDDDLGFSLFD